MAITQTNMCFECYDIYARHYEFDHNMRHSFSFILFYVRMCPVPFKYNTLYIQTRQYYAFPSTLFRLQSVPLHELSPSSLHLFYY